MRAGSSLTRLLLAVGFTTSAFLAILITSRLQPALAQETSVESKFKLDVQPMLKKYCLECHATRVKKGSLDLERFATLDDIRKDLKVWQALTEMLEAGEMPPKKKPQPSADEKKRLLTWVHGFLDAESLSRSGDPGHVPLRRLSNAEYDATIRDLTGVDLRPARDFPIDGAAGEGFTNAAEALTDISPTLLNKYLNAAKEIADHAVFLPDGFRFSLKKSRRDWTDESTAHLRQFYSAVAPSDGQLVFYPYLLATIRHRDALQAGQTTIAKIAGQEKLNAKYLAILWQTLSGREPSYPLDLIRQKWRTAAEKDGPAIAADIQAWQNLFWTTAKVGNYIRQTPNGYAESLSRQIPIDPTASERLPVRLAFKPSPGQNEVVLYLASHDVFSAESGSRIVWHRPRFEAPGQPPLLLRDYKKWRDGFDVDFSSIFANTAKYLNAAAKTLDDKNPDINELARTHALDPVFLKRWIEILNLNADRSGRLVPLIALEPLADKVEKANGIKSINGWRWRGQDLPIALSNSSDRVEHIPGTLAPHHVVVHPTPTEFVAGVWKSPYSGRVQVSARVAHAHAACGNGIAWWLEFRHEQNARVLAEGNLPVGGKASPSQTLTVAAGDQIVLAVDAKRGDHACDLTDIDLTVTPVGDSSDSWSLTKDLADSILDGTPHADHFGHKDTWSFAKGPTRPVAQSPGALIPDDSVLSHWRKAIIDPRHRDSAEKLAFQVQELLSGKRPNEEKSPDHLLYDSLVSPLSLLFQGVNAAPLGTPLANSDGMGLPSDRFGGTVDDASIAVPASSVTELHLPAALFFGRQFVVDAVFEKIDDNRVVQIQVTTDHPHQSLQPTAALLASPKGRGFSQVLGGTEAFRRVFPLFLCFPPVIPNDEVVSLKMFHREDDSLIRLFLDGEQTERINRLWREHLFISRQSVAENAYLPQFIGFTTQDAPKEVVAFFEARRPWFKQRADEFDREYAAAMPAQVDALLEFASRAYRRPLSAGENSELRALYRAIRQKGADHEEAVRGVLARILVSPAFLFRIEAAPPGKLPGPVNDFELATRLSYFLWSSMPDRELRRLAETGKLSDPKILSAQLERMLQDPRVRSLAIEFGTQWIHVRGFDEFNEKNEQLFPTFDAGLRQAMYEESILFFRDLFQSDRSVTVILDADYTFLNERLAKHYGIPGVAGPEWRQVNGVRKYGRGGVLGLASVQTKQAAASRTSPILRGNWLVETLLGEKLPRPPANVPRLPEIEGADKLTVRQLVEKHASVAECAVCHVRIDPFGYSLEKFDAIGRLREKDLGGMAIDTKARLKDGTEFEGIEGLRDYLLRQKKDVVVRLFCRRLSGYALGRAVTLSDTSLIDAMMAELKKCDGRVTAALRVIIQSPQFRMVRGSDFGE
jgi:hypothetical protein